jgi:membrane complex biogenesis BtpA family protein
MSTTRPLLGVIHLGASPSAARHSSVREVMSAALADAEAFASAGFDGLVVENFCDAPFHRGTHDDPVPPDVIANVAVAADRVARATGLPLGVNVLRNDGAAAFGVAAVTAARWVRVNVLTGAYVTDQGVIAGEAARLAAYRRQLRSDALLLADLMVKHAAPLAEFDLATGAKDLAERSGADGVVLSGARTGSPSTRRSSRPCGTRWGPSRSGSAPASTPTTPRRCGRAATGRSWARGARSAVTPPRPWTPSARAGCGLPVRASKGRGGSAPITEP